MDAPDDIAGMFGALIAVYFYLQLVANISSTIDFDSGDVRTRIEIGEVIASTLETTIVAGRAFGRIEYDAIVYDDASGAVIVDGLAFERIDPLTGAPIAFSVEALAVSTVGADDDRLDLRIHVEQLTFDVAALGPPAPVAAQLAALGLETVRADAALEIGYRLAASAADAHLTLDIDDVGAASIAIGVEDLHLTGVEFDDAMLAGALTHATVTVENAGALNVALGLLGVDGTPDGAADAGRRAAALIASFFSVDPVTGRATAPSAEAEAFAQDAGAAIERLAADQVALTVRLEPDAPVAFDALIPLIDGLGFDLRARGRLLQVLAPSAGLAPRPTTPIFADRPGDDATRNALLAAAEAFISGVGAPLAPELALELLEDAGGDGEVRRLRAEALIATGALEDAYGEALLAEAAGAPGAGAVVLSLRAELPLVDELAIEAEILGALTPPETIAALFPRAEAGDALAMRRLGTAYANGAGLPRSQTRAYFWYALAAAAGDPVALRRRDALRARHAADPEAAAVWADARADVDAEIVALWFGGLGAAVAATAAD